MEGGGNNPEQDHKSLMAQRRKWLNEFNQLIFWANNNRGQKIANFLGRSGLWSKITSYIGNLDLHQEAIISAHHLPLHEILSRMKERLWPELERSARTLDLKYFSPTVYLTERLKFGVEQEDTIEALSVMRSILCLDSRIVRNSQTLKKYFLAEIVFLYEKLRLSLPERLRFLISERDIALLDNISDDDLEEKEEEEGDAVYLRAHQEALNRGAEPQFAERAAQVALAKFQEIRQRTRQQLEEVKERQRELMIQQLDSLISNYPNPEVLVDILLNPQKIPK